MATILVQLLLSGIAIGAVYALIGLGFALFLRAMRLLNFSHAEMVTIGAFIGLFLTRNLGLPFIIAFPVAVAATALIGVILERVIFRPLWVKADDPFLVRAVFATIALATLLTNVALQLGGPFELRFPSPLGSDVIKLGSVVITPQRVLVIGVSIVVVLLLQLFFQKTEAGLAMRAVMLDRETAQLMGIDVRRSVAITFALSAALGAVAGILVAPIVFWSFQMGAKIGIKAFAALTLGGLYSFPGAIVGGLLIGILEAFTGLFLSSTYRDVIVFAILIFMLLVRPQGLLGKESGRVDR